MKNKKYQSFEEIEMDLKLLSLQRQIAVEELSSLKHQFQEDLQPLNWIQSGFKIAKKFSTLMILKKIFK
ncbi:DUF6327 family protein [Cellulophaga tyrosinoxydans]|jgi:hypothetical protein|uniref:Glutaminyl-tRNA synthetase n=1 Tax=Cellulophaga tyrosinoxydans TaxID=504486 RepID=A0A1W1YL07_9FLAO|nr:DUF6327 family protein [Cellulophaga tyrosinoxydans]SMC36491.1 hypothetical protein SAMN05660703_0570 [Cellulophaga tyrosinoxydans]|tara:strand:+ start:820 stop:1026 length:207 start_codon:yes stop_codon:yes gene_type:complete